MLTPSLFCQVRACTAKSSSPPYQEKRIFAEYMFDEVVPFWVRQFTRETLDSHDGWQRNDELKVHEYLGICLGGASATILSTTGLALSLFLPYVVFPRNDTYFDAFPA